MFDLYGRGGQLLDGALMTVRLCLSVIPFVVVLGLVGAGTKLSRRRWLRLLGGAYTTIIRGVPELVIILLIYFGGTMALQGLVGWLSDGASRIDIPAFWSGVAALSLVEGAFAAEIFRAAIQSVPAGEVEAAVASGMSPVQVFRRILLPQLWRYALPGLGNLFQVLIKDTALISVVGLEETLRKAAIGAGAARAPFTFYGAAMGLFLAMTTVSVIVFNRLEKRAARGVAGR